MTSWFATPLRYPIALAAGLALPLAFAPFSLAPLAVLALALVFLLVSAADERDGAGVLRLGYLFGLGYAGLGVYWIFISVSRYGGGTLAASIATPILVALFALYPMVALWLGYRLGHRRPGLTAAVTLPLTWILMEWVRSWLFTGATWLSIGYSHIDMPVAALAPVTGQLGVGLVVALLAGALAWLIRRPTAPRAALAVALLAVYVGSAALDRVDWTAPEGEPVEVALIQGNVPQDRKWAPDNRRDTLRYYRDATRRHLGTRLIVWPETAVPAFYHQVREDWLAPLARAADDAGSTVITGLPVINVASAAAFNAVMVLGDPDHMYYKRHLVPFGEYVPFRDWIGPALDFVGAPLGDFTPGTQATLLRAGDLRIGVSVCYEVTFGGEVADTVPAADLLLNVSNDGWFGRSSAAHQHLEMARMRALETGREMMRATNTGITALIAADGSVTARAPMFERTVLTGEIQPRRGATPYSRWEDWPVVGVVSAALLIATLAGFTGRDRRLFR